MERSQFFKLYVVESRAGYQGRHTNGFALGPRFSGDAVGPFFESFALSFFIVFLNADEPF